MVCKVGNRVVKLKRIRVAGITLERLTPGQWRYLKTEEVEQLQRLLVDDEDKGIQPANKTK